MRRLVSRRHDDRGAAAVEFALVSVPLLYLVFGIITFGFMLGFRQNVSQAAAEGARAAAIAPVGLTDAQLQDRARSAISDSLTSNGVTCTSSGTLVSGAKTVGTCTVSGRQACTSGTSTATCIKVSIDYLYSANPMVPTVGLGIVMPDHLKYESEVQVS